MNWLWRYLTGYLTIEIDAQNGEELLNKAIADRVNIWNLRCKNGKITGNISIKNFNKLRLIKRGIKSKIKILNKYGMIFKTRKYNNRFGFLFGIILYVVILMTLSNFIWTINVEGNKNISTNDILFSCQKLGIKEGTLKRNINNKYDAQRIQLVQDGIAWCSLNIEGSILTVNLSEAAVSNKEQRELPSNLKASADGIIKKINISSGVPQVKVGDIVSRGQLLVSGIKQNSNSTVFIHAEGEIIADTIRVFSAEGRFNQKIKVKSGQVIKRHSVNFFNIKIPLFLGNLKQDYQYSKSIKALKLFDKKIPIKTATEYYEVLNEKVIEYDQQSLEKLLYNDINQQIKKFDFININEKNREIIKTKDGILLKIEYSCEENIALQDAILLNTEN